MAFLIVEVAQVYLGFPEADLEFPKMLQRFDKMMIKTVNFEITIRNNDIEIWGVMKQS